MTVAVSDHLKRPYSASDRRIPRTIIQPAQRFAAVETAGGIVMLAGAVIALLWANSPWDQSYRDLFDTAIEFRIGDVVHLDLTLHEWINDGLMSLFFLVVGLEIKRQLVHGELRDRRAAALPALAALGGMIVPAAIYIIWNLGGATDGFGVPVATDIAFAVGVVTLAGSRVPLGVRIFILTLAVVDDIGGIIVIAIFYAEGVSGPGSRSPLRRSPGPGSRSASRSVRSSRTSASGSSVGTRCTRRGWKRRSPVWSSACSRLRNRSTTRVGSAKASKRSSTTSTAATTRCRRRSRRTSGRSLRRSTGSSTGSPRGCRSASSRSSRIANAGVSVSTSGIDTNVFMGVLTGLVLGKLIGVVAFTWLAVRLGVGRLPDRTTWSHVVAIGATAGIGFTVALFVAGLSFDDPDLLRSAKLGILAASTAAGILGYTLLRRTARSGDPT